MHKPNLNLILPFIVGIVRIIPSGDPMLGESYTLTCKVLVAEHLCPSITYQWIKNNSTVTQLEAPPNSLSFSPLRLSDAGQYNCQVTINSSPFKINNITVIGFHDIKFQSKLNSVCENFNRLRYLFLCSPSSYLCDTDK